MKVAANCDTAKLSFGADHLPPLHPRDRGSPRTKPREVAGPTPSGKPSVVSAALEHACDSTALDDFIHTIQSGADTRHSKVARGERSLFEQGHESGLLEVLVAGQGFRDTLALHDDE